MSYHRTIVSFEILGDRPWDGDVSSLAFDIVEGDFSGAELSRSSREVDADQMHALLTMQGSDPSFLIPEEDDEE